MANSHEIFQDKLQAYYARIKQQVAIITTLHIDFGDSPGFDHDEATKIEANILQQLHQQYEGNVASFDKFEDSSGSDSQSDSVVVTQQTQQVSQETYHEMECVPIEYYHSQLSPSTLLKFCTCTWCNVASNVNGDNLIISGASSYCRICWITENDLWEDANSSDVTLKLFVHVKLKLRSENVQITAKFIFQATVSLYIWTHHLATRLDKHLENELLRRALGLYE